MPGILVNSERQHPEPDVSRSPVITETGSSREYVNVYLKLRVWSPKMYSVSKVLSAFPKSALMECSTCMASGDAPKSMPSTISALPYTDIRIWLRLSGTRMDEALTSILNVAGLGMSEENALLIESKVSHDGFFRSD